MIDDTPQNRRMFMAAGYRHGYPDNDVPLIVIAEDLDWPVTDTIVFAWDGHGRTWETDGGLGDPPTVLEAP